MRRGITGPPYLFTSPWFVIAPYHPLLLILGMVGAIVTYLWVNKLERLIEVTTSSKVAKALALGIFIFLVIDLIFLYRGVPTFRIASAGEIGLKSEEIIPTTTTELIATSDLPIFFKPIAITINYLAAVWHATLLAILLASLFVVAFARYTSKGVFATSGFRSNLAGALLAIPQPFCSCCASPIAASMYKKGAALSTSLSFLVTSPMLNITTLILAIVLLPIDFAILRIAAGIVLAVPLSYALAYIIEKRGLLKRESKHAERGLMYQLAVLLNQYCQLFDIERLTLGKSAERASSLISIWLWTAWRMAKLFLPIFFIGGILASILVTLVAQGVGNSPLGVLISSVGGTLIMISTWTELPVAAILAHAGFTGPAAALLVTMPAVSIPCLLIFGGALGSLRASILLGVMVFLLGLIAGLLYL